LTIPVAALVLVCGCASRGEISQFKRQLNYLEKSNKRLESSVANLDSLLQEQFKGTQRMSADINSSFNSVDERLRVVEGWLRDSDNRYNQLFQKLEVQQEKASRQEVPPSADTTRPQVTFDPQTLYDGAYMNLVKGNYDLAILGFSDYLRYFPRSSLAPSAQYWIAECHYAKRDFQKASEEFKRLLQEYPKSGKISAALYKLGLIYLESGDKASARRYLAELLDKFPQSAEAELAKEIAEIKD